MKKPSGGKPTSKRAPAAIKRRFPVPDRDHAHSLMRQAIRSLLAQNPLEPHIANYLIESMRHVLAGEDAKRAFALHDRRGPKTKSWRDFEIAAFIEELRGKNISLDDAKRLAADKFLDRTEEEKADDRRIGTIKTAYENGIQYLEHYLLLKRELGDDCAEAFLGLLR